MELRDGMQTLSIEFGPTVHCDGCRLSLDMDGDAFDRVWHLTESQAAQVIAELAQWLDYRAGLRADLEADHRERRERSVPSGEVRG